jgi:excisionase family DNA binding protein
MTIDIEKLVTDVATLETNIAYMQKEIISLREKNNKTDKPVYTTKEASVLLGMKASTIRRWINEGKLKAVPSCRPLLITAESINLLIKKP